MKISSKHDNLDIYSPWIIFYRKIESLFHKDPDVRVEYDNDSYEIKLYVEGQEKADAIEYLLPEEYTCGNVTVKITVNPSNLDTSMKTYLEKAFQGNEAFSHVTFIDHIPDMYISNPVTYCVFKKEVVQYAADDMSSEHGIASTLYENIAKEVMGHIDGVFFCTDTE